MMTPMKKAAGGYHTTTTEQKRFATLQAQFAKHGHALQQSGPGDGPAPSATWPNAGAWRGICPRWQTQSNS